jgi:hypothetical protein
MDISSVLLERGLEVGLNFSSYCQLENWSDCPNIAETTW